MRSAGDPDAPDAVDRQIEAYNARDLEAFAACYAEDVSIVSADGSVRTEGRAQLGEQYDRWFRRNPELHVEVLNRIRVGRYVIDEERVTGTPGGEVHAVAIYALDEAGLIERVQFLP